MTLFRRKKKTFVINEPDPEYNVVYLGNVLTVMAKGDGCVDKPLSLIWRTYCTRTRPDLPMLLSVTNAGLKANTKQQGLTEYWAHRITFCAAPSQYKKVFCWVYKHEGKKLKPELRCHAVLCRKDDMPGRMSITLQDRILAALRDYKREKICKQNLRLARLPSSLPLRRLMLSTGGQNFRPPMTRSKSAPKLHSIDEEEDDAIEEVDEEELELEEDVHDLLDSDQDSTSNPNMNLNLNLDLLLHAQISVESEFELDTPIRRDSTFSNMQIIVDDLLMIDDDIGRLKIEESDSVSDESGYHEEKASLEDDGQIIQHKSGSNSEDHMVILFPVDDIEITSL